MELVHNSTIPGMADPPPDLLARVRMIAPYLRGAAATATSPTVSDESLDAVGLLPGSNTKKNVVEALLIRGAGLVVGDLYGNNRTHERIVRLAF